MAKDQTCRRCGGKGVVRCPKCHGTGKVGKRYQQCPACSGFLDFFSGSGRVKCDACNGTGKWYR